MLCSLQGSLLTLAIFTLFSFIYFSLNPSCRALPPLGIVQDRALSSSFHVLLDHSQCCLQKLYLPPLKPFLSRVPGYTTTSDAATNNHQQQRRRTASNSSLSSHSDEGRPSVSRSGSRSVSRSRYNGSFSKSVSRSRYKSTSPPSILPSLSISPPPRRSFVPPLVPGIKPSPRNATTETTSLSHCNCNHILNFLRCLDQFGKTKVHLHGCVFFGLPDPPAPCTCPLRQACGSLDALIGRLHAAYEEHGWSPETNPFGNRAIRVSLREVNECQAKAKERKAKVRKRKRKRRSVANAKAKAEKM
ncbi:hypothetical protein FF1_022675 [Malus domestica]